MEKPVIFFSHSSKDEGFLNKIKNIIDKKTGQAVQIFLSSDGQSIPFGRNWVHTIEEALKNASLMFVFVSPNSIASNWVYFEAGYIYSKGVHVVPVGILGVDLNQLTPPLSLLQGFNLDKVDTLGNIVATINKVYNTQFDSEFDNLSYAQVFEEIKDNAKINSISKINVHLYKELMASDFIEIENFLKETEYDIMVIDKGDYKEIVGYGITINIHVKGIIFMFDGLLIVEYLTLIKNLMDRIVNLHQEEIVVYFSKESAIAGDFQKQSALLKDTEINLVGRERFSYNNVEFSFSLVSPYPIMYIYSDRFLIDIDWLEELLDILIEREVIFQGANPEEYLKMATIG